MKLSIRNRLHRALRVTSASIGAALLKLAVPVRAGFRSLGHIRLNWGGFIEACAKHQQEYWLFGHIRLNWGGFIEA